MREQLSLRIARKRAEYYERNRAVSGSDLASWRDDAMLLERQLDRMRVALEEIAESASRQSDTSTLPGWCQARARSALSVV